MANFSQSLFVNGSSPAEPRKISLLISEEELEALDWLVEADQTPQKLLQAFIEDLTRTSEDSRKGSAARSWLSAHQCKT